MLKFLSGRAVVPGAAQGFAVVSRQQLSLWGGLNPKTGEVIDRRHDCSGRIICGKIFVFPRCKGSSTSSAVLMEAIHAGVAPAAIINSSVEPILALGSIVADTLYQKSIPIVSLSQGDFEIIQEDDQISIHADGTVIINCMR